MAVGRRSELLDEKSFRTNVSTIFIRTAEKLMLNFLHSRNMLLVGLYQRIMYPSLFSYLPHAISKGCSLIHTMRNTSCGVIMVVYYKIPV